MYAVLKHSSRVMPNLESPHFLFFYDIWLHHHQTIRIHLKQKRELFCISANLKLRCFSQKNKPQNDVDLHR